MQKKEHTCPGVKTLYGDRKSLKAAFPPVGLWVNLDIPDDRKTVKENRQHDGE
jgi:hypothetical protein